MVAVALAALVALPVLLSGCALGASGDDDGYHVTAYFAAAVGLYPHGDVTSMGIRIGTVDAVEVEATRVRVDMTIDADVPLPADVEATIEPLQLIGERNVVLFPAWNEAMAAEGRPQAGDGSVIGLDRTHTPVEPDEGLEAFNDLARSLDPDVVGSLIADSAAVLEGQGANLGTAIDQAASLTDVFSRTDEQLVGAAEALHQLAATVNTRDQQLAEVVRSFSGATEILASERDEIARFLSALVGLVEHGRGLVETYGSTLPIDIANLAALASVLHENSATVEQLVETFPAIATGISNSYDPSVDGLRLRASFSPTLVALIDAFSGILGILPPAGGG